MLGGSAIGKSAIGKTSHAGNIDATIITTDLGLTTYDTTAPSNMITTDLGLATNDTTTTYAIHDSKLSFTAYDSRAPSQMDTVEAELTVTKTELIINPITKYMTDIVDMELDTEPPTWSATRPNRRKLAERSLSDIQDDRKSDFVEIVSIGNGAVYVREEELKELDSLEFLLDDIENMKMTVSEDYNFRIESDRELRMDLIEGSITRRVSKYRRSGFNREEFAEEVEDNDIDLG